MVGEEVLVSMQEYMGLCRSPRKTTPTLSMLFTTEGYSHVLPLAHINASISTYDIPIGPHWLLQISILYSNHLHFQLFVNSGTTATTSVEILPVSGTLPKYVERKHLHTHSSLLRMLYSNPPADMLPCFSFPRTPTSMIPISYCTR